MKLYSQSSMTMAALVLIAFASIALALPTLLPLHQEARESDFLFDRFKRDDDDDDDDEDTPCKILEKMKCGGLGDACGCHNETFCVSCKEGLECSDGFCEAMARLGEECTSSLECFHPEATLVCRNFVCAAREIYSAGEECDSDSAELVNGGCLEDLTCVSKKCSPHYALGEDCSENEAGCGAGAFCHSETEVCTRALGEGESCEGLSKDYGSRSVCKTTLACVQGKCLKRFSRGVNESCSANTFTCKGGLYCTGDSGASIEESVCAEDEMLNQRCDNASSVCGPGTRCVCNSKNQFTCQPIVPSSDIKPIESYLKCTAKNDLDLGMDAFDGGKDSKANKIHRKCEKEFRGAIQVVRKSASSMYCSSAAGLYSPVSSLALVLILAFVYLL